MVLKMPVFSLNSSCFLVYPSSFRDHSNKRIDAGSGSQGSSPYLYVRGTFGDVRWRREGHRSGGESRGSARASPCWGAGGGGCGVVGIAFS